jgi:hypothetical protein
MDGLTDSDSGFDPNCIYFSASKTASVNYIAESILKPKFLAYFYVIYKYHKLFQATNLEYILAMNLLFEK